MTILTLQFNDRKIKDYAITNGQRLTIGRNVDNDIIIDSLGVSGYHACIEGVASSFVLQDMDSTNGVFVNKQRTKLHTLQHNDIVRIGKHELVFDRLVFDRSAVKDNQPDDEVFQDDKTRFLDTREHRELIQQATAPPQSVDEPKSSRWFSRLISKINR